MRRHYARAQRLPRLVAATVHPEWARTLFDTDTPFGEVDAISERLPYMAVITSATPKSQPRQIVDLALILDPTLAAVDANGGPDGKRGLYAGLLNGRQRPYSAVR